MTIDELVKALGLEGDKVNTLKKEFNAKEKELSQVNSKVAKLELWLDLFVKGEAETNVADYDDLAYRQLYMAENELIEALNEFNFYLHRNGLGSNLVVSGVLSDGSANAPVVVANRIIVEIEWYI